jgi:hypothetical protein|tara:strand:- start:719 stop:997 length:279 start_codon:yes stop_codon:yes gene_type:complete
MTGKEMVELVQQHHPELGPQEIIKMLNRASDDYTARTRLLDSATKFTTVVDQRYYGLDDSILEIRAVDYTNDDGDLEAIPRLIGRPTIRDIT